MTGPVQVEVQLFARLRELAGRGLMRAQLEPGATARDAWRALVGEVPRLRDADGGLRVAVNREYASWEAVLQDGDEVAFLPPVAGGAPSVNVLLTDAPLDPRQTEAAVRTNADGAVCTFTGVVRDNAAGRRVESIDYEAYGAMAEAEMRRVGEEALSRTGATAVALHHRVGTLPVGEASVVVSASAPHRAEAFACCRLAIDALKERVPIWKREVGEGGAVWVDEQARARGPVAG